MKSAFERIKCHRILHPASGTVFSMPHGPGVHTCVYVWVLPNPHLSSSSALPSSHSVPATLKYTLLMNLSHSHLPHVVPWSCEVAHIIYERTQESCMDAPVLQAAGWVRGRLADFAPGVHSCSNPMSSSSDTSSSSPSATSFAGFQCSLTFCHQSLCWKLASTNVLLSFPYRVYRRTYTVL